MNYDSIRMSIKLDENETYAAANNSMIYAYWNARKRIIKQE